MDRQDVRVKAGRTVASVVVCTLREIGDVWVAVGLYGDRVRYYRVKECCRRRC